MIDDSDKTKKESSCLKKDSCVEKEVVDSLDRLKYLALVLFMIPMFSIVWSSIFNNDIDTPFLSEQVVVEQQVSEVGNGPALEDAPLMLINKGWGPCLTVGQCFEKITITNKGSMTIVNGSGTTTYTLSSEDNQKIKGLQQELKELSCSYNPVMDYWATYEIHEREESIIFPGCEQELKHIDEIIAHARKLEN